MNPKLKKKLKKEKKKKDKDIEISIKNSEKILNLVSLKTLLTEPN